jgi:hypothetical protein
MVRMSVISLRRTATQPGAVRYMPDVRSVRHGAAALFALAQRLERLTFATIANARDRIKTKGAMEVL